MRVLKKAVLLHPDTIQNTMITLRDIITEYALDQKQVAERLFPEAKYPALALTRILGYSLELDLKQISIIANMANCNPVDLANTIITSNN